MGAYIILWAHVAAPTYLFAVMRSNADNALTPICDAKIFIDLLWKYLQHIRELVSVTIKVVLNS